MTFQYGDYSLLRTDFYKDEFDMDPTFYPMDGGHARYVRLFYATYICPSRIIVKKMLID